MSPRLGELPGDAADLHYRRSGSIGEHHRHLQEQTKEVANVVGAVLGEALRTVAALQQESVAGKHQRRETGKLRFDIAERLGVGIIRHLQSRLGPPGIGAPPRRIQPPRHMTVSVSRAPYWPVNRAAKMHGLWALIRGCRQRLTTAIGALIHGHVEPRQSCFFGCLLTIPPQPARNWPIACASSRALPRRSDARPWWRRSRPFLRPS